MTEIKYSSEKPPNWKILEEKFGVKWGDVLVTYGNTVYSKHPIPDDLKAHEAIHVRQQIECGIEGWWEMYMDDPQFRLMEELEAYRAQFKYVKSICKDKNTLFRQRDKIARALCSAVYGGIISYSEAFKQIGQ